jgi:hypothetical protein
MEVNLTKPTNSTSTRFDAAESELPEPEDRNGFEYHATAGGQLACITIPSAARPATTLSTRKVRTRSCRTAMCDKATWGCAIHMPMNISATLGV